MKNRIYTALFYLILVSAPVQADSIFGNLLRGVADQAVHAATDGRSLPQTPQSNEAGTAEVAAGTPAPATPPAKAGCPKTRAKPLPALGARPENYQPAILWPEETGCDYYKFADLKFEKAIAQKRAFDDASRVRCSDCEGGYSYDAWARHFVGKGSDSMKKFDEMLLALNVGQSLSWKGKKYVGTVQATGEHPIGPFPCRQYHWSLKDKNNVVAEREGLYCAVQGDYSASAKWQEVL